VLVEVSWNLSETERKSNK